MPIYDFQCIECGHQDEMMRKSSADSTMECPACHKGTFSKMLSAPRFKLNGTGWYETDFKNKNKKPAAKSDTKPAATTETKAAAPASSDGAS